MKTVELSEAKARTLIAYLAPQWANLAVQIVATNVPYNTPYRMLSETRTSRTFLARVKRRKEQRDAIGAVLVGLGATLPTVDRSAAVKLYTPPPGSRAKRGEIYQSGFASKEKARLAEAIETSAQ
jgi:hypothetical protein